MSPSGNGPSLDPDQAVDNDVRVLVCGGRDYADWDTVRDRLSLFHLGSKHGGGLAHKLRWPATVTIVHGGARGADEMAGMVAALEGYFVEVHPADWNTHGRAAGPIRNQQMLDLGADLVVAFPGGRGTADMVRRARKAGVPVMEVQP